MNTHEKKNKHMTLDVRIEIQECLAKGMSFKSIGNRIGKNPTRISREVKLHAQMHKSGYTKTDEICPKLLKTPFVCNGYDKKSKRNCPYARRLYFAKTAQKAYEELRSESRSKFPSIRKTFMKQKESFPKL